MTIDGSRSRSFHSIVLATWLFRKMMRLSRSHCARPFKKWYGYIVLVTNINLKQLHSRSLLGIKQSFKLNLKNIQIVEVWRTVTRYGSGSGIGLWCCL
jgi:hypothetical protein